MTSDFTSDKNQELLRYDSRAESLLKLGRQNIRKWGSESMPAFLRSPYIFYEQRIQELVSSNHFVLELGSGTGLHTYALLKTGSYVTATDISPKSLILLEKDLISESENLATQVADMENLPFGNNSFDVIASAGSLSYGDPSKVDREIHRLLKPHGVFICVDSLNHNPIYRLNRWLNYVRGRRSKSTLMRMPTLRRINSIAAQFDSVEVEYFGSLTWLMPLFCKLLGESLTADISDQFDRTISTKKSAFKFVMVAKNPMK